MSNVIEIGKAMTGADAAFQKLAVMIKNTYDAWLKHSKAKTHTKKGVPILYHDDWHVCCAFALAEMKQHLPEQYQLLVDEAGSEFQLIRNTLLN